MKNLLKKCKIYWGEGGPRSLRGHVVALEKKKLNVHFCKSKNIVMAEKCST